MLLIPVLQTASRRLAVFVCAVILLALVWPADSRGLGLPYYRPVVYTTTIPYYRTIVKDSTADSYYRSVVGLYVLLPVSSIRTNVLILESILSVCSRGLDRTIGLWYYSPVVGDLGESKLEHLCCRKNPAILEHPFQENRPCLLPTPEGRRRAETPDRSRSAYLNFFPPADSA